MYNFCNCCGREQTCASAINVLKQIANLVCVRDNCGCQTVWNGYGCQSVQTNSGAQTTRTGCGCQTVQTNSNAQTTRSGCGCQNGYPVDISGRVYVSHGGWCNSIGCQTANGCYQTANGCYQTSVTYGSNCPQNGVYGGTSRRCGYAFNTLNT